MEKLSLAGFVVNKHVVVDSIEIDVLALEYVDGMPRPMVYVFEVKRRPKPKVYRQLEKRRALADYLYIAIPYCYYSWALRKLEPWIGIAVLMRGELHIVRMARYIGNGGELLKRIQLVDVDRLKGFRDRCTLGPPSSTDTRVCGMDEVGAVGRDTNSSRLC